MTAVLRPSRADAVPNGLEFTLPKALIADAPPEARGLARDGVRLLVSRRADDRVEHARFRDLASFLASGDLVVANASATRPAAVLARRAVEAAELHLSTALRDGSWIVELRRLGDRGTLPLLDARAGERLRLPCGATVELLTPYRAPNASVGTAGVRLWRAALRLPDDSPDVDAYLARAGFPIRYGYVRDPWPLAAYQTVFAAEPGSAEMPSAGRPFTYDTLASLGGAGVGVATIVLHAGVASLEAHEPPHEEFFRVPPQTVEAVERTRARGGRVVAVGTTVVRALESAARGGALRPAEGWTDLVIAPPRRPRVVDALITGFHEPRASHLAMLESIAGRAHLRVAYDAALRERYLWHEFGDVHLIV